MESASDTESGAETPIAVGDRSWGLPAVPRISGRHVLLIAASWVVLAAFILFPEFDLIALGMVALGASVAEIARGDA